MLSYPNVWTRLGPRFNRAHPCAYTTHARAPVVSGQRWPGARRQPTAPVKPRSTWGVEKNPAR